MMKLAMVMHILPLLQADWIGSTLKSPFEGKLANPDEACFGSAYPPNSKIGKCSE